MVRLPRHSPGLGPESMAPYLRWLLGGSGPWPTLDQALAPVFPNRRGSPRPAPHRPLWAPCARGWRRTASTSSARPWAWPGSTPPCPVARHADAHTLRLPSYSRLDDRQVERIVDALCRP